MPTPPLPEAELRKRKMLVEHYLKLGHPPPGITGKRLTIGKCGAIYAAMSEIGLKRSAATNFMRPLVQSGLEPDWSMWKDPTGFVHDDLPDDLPAAEELIERRKRETARRLKAAKAREIMSVRVTLDGPIGILHMGDPHVDDPGTDIEALERHVNLCRDTEGLFAANVGDLQNNWVGRLAHLYSEQATTAREAWKLTEWLVKSCEWLYLVGGNHDCWSGAGDPINWMIRDQVGVYEAWGVRLNLRFPNGKDVRVNARHDFAGHSMWNSVHGPMKAIQMGWRDHILTCGHKHVSGYGILKDPASGLVSHAIRVAGYKLDDAYAKKLGLPNQNISPAVVTVIDPSRADDDPGLVTVFHDVEMGADFIRFLRRKKG